MTAQPDDAFTVDVEELFRTIGEMHTCESDLHRLAESLESRIDELHTTWQGEAATAQRAAQAQWEKGFREMREALGPAPAGGRDRTRQLRRGRAGQRRDVAAGAVSSAAYLRGWKRHSPLGWRRRSNRSSWAQRWW